MAVFVRGDFSSPDPVLLLLPPAPTPSFSYSFLLLLLPAPTPSCASLFVPGPFRVSSHPRCSVGVGSSRISQFILKQVRPNKDTARGRDEVKITERVYPALIAGCSMQIICRCIAACLQVICRLFAVRDPYFHLSSDSISYPLNSKKKKRVTDGQTDGQTLKLRCVGASKNY